MAVLTYTAVKPGIAGNLIIVQMIPAGSGPIATAVVTDLGLNQWQIDVTYNNAGGFTTTQVAAALMADPAVAVLVTATGDGDFIAPIAPGFARLQGGTTGQGQ